MPIAERLARRREGVPEANPIVRLRDGIISGVEVDEKTGLCTGVVTRIINGEAIFHPLVITSGRLNKPDQDLNPFERAVKIMAAQKLV